MISIIIHELTHWVNDCEGKINQIIVNIPNSLLTQKIMDILYFLRDTECNARCSQFGHYLSKINNVGILSDYEEITKLTKIENLLSLFENNITNSKILKKETGKSLNTFLKIFKNYKKKIINVYYYYLTKNK